MADLRLEFLDVGQGDGTLIEFPNREIMLVDLGSLKNRKITLKDINKYVYDFFPQLHLTGHIDYLIITHGDQDHYNLIESMFDHNSVSTIGTLVYSGQLTDYKGFKSYLSKLQRRAAKLLVLPNSYHSKPAKPKWTIGGVKVWILSANFPTVSATATNPKSIVLRLQIGKVVIILGADATEATEQSILKAYKSDLTFLECDLLKVSHHGSETSSSPEWIKATIGPKGTTREIAIAVSADMRDGFGLPRCSITQRYLDFGTLWKFAKNVGWVCWTDSGRWDDQQGKYAILSTLLTADQGIQWEYLTDGDAINIKST